MVLSPGCASESAEDARTLLPEELTQAHKGTYTRVLTAELPGLEDSSGLCGCSSLQEWKVRYEGHCAGVRSQELVFICQ